MIETAGFDIDRVKARDLWRDYRKHQHYSTPIDREVQRTYQLIAQGRVVIRALESVAKAGLNAEGLPKLAIARADAKECFLRLSGNGSAIFSVTNAWGTDHWKRHRIELPAGSFANVPAVRNRWDAARAIIPLIPIHLRPKRGLANYHILWEAEWTRLPPVDPLLLRRIGKGDIWLVVAAWDLTEVERAALAARISA